MNKLFVVVREDLSPAQQAVQAMHAAREFAAEHRETELGWFLTSNHIALLSVETEADLLRLVEIARWKETKVSIFREPDLGNSVTAIALEPKAQIFCRALPLAKVGHPIKK